MKNKFQMYSRLLPTLFGGYAEVLIAGANFEQSEMYISWNGADVEFEERVDLKKLLWFQEYENCDHIQIYHLTEKMERWSKYNRDKLGIEDALIAKSLEIVDDEKFVFSTNKDFDNSKFLEKKGVELPQSPYGLNSYGTYHNIIILSARNPSPAHIVYLDTMADVPSSEVRVAVHQQAMLQIAMRIIRDKDDQTTKRIIVPDLATALFLQSVLKGAKLISCLIDETELAPKKRGRKSSGKSPNELRRESRQRIRQSQLEDLEKLWEALDSADFDQSKMLSPNSCLEFTSYNSNKQTRIYVSFWEAVQSKRPYSHELSSLDSLETLLAECTTKQLRKEDNRLILSTIFDGDRNKANINSIWGLWLDIDDGDMSPKELARILSSVRFTVYATYSSTKKQLRYRVFIPLAKPIPFTVYESIIGQILHKVEIGGYPLRKRREGDPRKAHGIDPAVGPWLPVYLPCQPADPSGKMFKVFKGGIRRPIDPADWVENSILPTAEDAPSIVPEPPEEIDEVAKAKALETFKLAPARAGNDAQKQLGIDLWKAGVTDVESLARELEAAAKGARSEKDRKRNCKQLAKWIVRHFVKGRQPPKPLAVSPTSGTLPI